MDTLTKDSNIVFEVEVYTANNNVLTWEIEDTNAVNVMKRISERLRLVNAVTIKIVGA
jgi:hypothetical protein